MRDSGQSHVTSEHVGEWRVVLSGAELPDVFTAIARVIADAAGPPSGEPSPWQRVTVTARDRATLLVDWANELLGISEMAGRAFTELRDVRIMENEDGSSAVSAEVRGRPVSPWLSPMKAATYHALVLERRGPQWHAEVLFDV
jgi:SHS2 domain-containing protein